MFRIPFLSHKKIQSIAGKGGHRVAQDHHKLEREQFREVLESYGATSIQERLNILDLFLSTEDHITLTELENLVKDRAPEFQDRAFLKETMEMFCQFGFAEKRIFETQEALYEHQHLGTHHDHFICTRCGLIQEFANRDLERLQINIARELQFHPLQHKLEIYGLCAECMEQRDSTIPLQYAANGERVQIVQIMGGREVQARLTDMGLSVGSCIEVISNHPSGPFIVAVNDVRLAINTGIAQKIVVEHSCHLDA